MVVIDAVVVGAGPAGSTLAALLAGRGCSVALIDRDNFPRDKVCGEFLSYDALPVLEHMDVDLSDAPAIDRCRIVGRKRTYEFAFPAPARGISRFRLDEMLFRKASASGARTSPSCTVSGVSARRVVTDGGEINARVVVGAWGRWGRFDSQLGRKFVRDRTHRNFGFKRHYLAAPDDDPAVISLFSFRRGYLGASAIERQQTNLCGLVHASRLAGHTGGWESLVDQICAEEPHLEQLFRSHEAAQEEFLSSTPVIFRPRSAAEDGIFMIGDASGVIDPLTGSGMAMAIHSALLAAPFVLEAIAGKADIALRRYSRRHAEFFAKRISWSRRLAYLLPRPRMLDAVLKAAHKSAGPFFLRKTRANAGEVTKMCDAWF